MLSRVTLNNEEKGRLFLVTLLRLSTIFGGILALAGITLSESLVGFVFGDNYGAAGQLLGVGLWPVIPLAWGIATQQYWVNLGVNSVIIRSVLAGVVVMTGALPWLTAEFESAGPLLAVGLGTSTWAAGMLWKFFRHQPGLFYRTMVSPLLGILAAVATLAATGDAPATLSLPLSMLAPVPVSLLTGILFPAERDYLRNLVMRP